MNWKQSPAQAKALYFVEHVTHDAPDAPDAPDNVDDDLNDGASADWPPLLTRRQAAQFLGVGVKWLSDISGEGPRGGKLHSHKVRGKVHWRLEELQAYRDGRQRQRQNNERGS